MPNRSADPWSAFLAPRDRGAASGVTPGVAPGAIARSDQEPSHAPAPGDPGPAAAADRIRARLEDAGAALTFAELCRGTGLGMLEVADAVEALRDTGFVVVERREPGPDGADSEEIVRLVG